MAISRRIVSSVKNRNTILFAAAFTLCLSASAQAHNTCIDAGKIDTVETKDGGAALEFTMRDGVYWRNTLLKKCTGLVQQGFRWINPPHDGTICENGQMLSIRQTDEICTLGKFEKVSPPPKAGG